MIMPENFNKNLEQKKPPPHTHKKKEEKKSDLDSLSKFTY